MKKFLPSKLEFGRHETAVLCRETFSELPQLFLLGIGLFFNKIGALLFLSLPLQVKVES